MRLPDVIVSRSGTPWLHGCSLKLMGRLAMGSTLLRHASRRSAPRFAGVDEERGTSVRTRAGLSRFPLRPRGPRVELRIMAEDARLVERNPSVRGEVGGHVFLRRDRLGQRRERGIEFARVRERVREGISRAFPNLEQR